MDASISARNDNEVRGVVNRFLTWIAMIPTASCFPCLFQMPISETTSTVERNEQLFGIPDLREDFFDIRIASNRPDEFRLTHSLIIQETNVRRSWPKYVLRILENPPWRRDAYHQSSHVLDHRDEFSVDSRVTPDISRIAQYFDRACLARQRHQRRHSHALRGYATPCWSSSALETENRGEVTPQSTWISSIPVIPDFSIWYFGVDDGFWPITIVLFV